MEVRNPGLEVVRRRLIVALVCTVFLKEVSLVGPLSGSDLTEAPFFDEAEETERAEVTA